MSSAAAAPANAAAGEQFPFVRGGPTFVPHHVGVLTSIPDFKADALDSLQNLQLELIDAGDFEDELSVDELRIFSEEELVEKALAQDILEDDLLAPLVPEGFDGRDADQSNTGKEIVSCTSESCVTSEESAALTCHANKSKGKLKKKRGTKRGRAFDRDCRAAELEGSYLAKVQELAEIKQKQDEDKLSVNLHSFKANSKIPEEANATSEKVKKKSLRFVTCPTKVKALRSGENVPIHYPEVVLCVEVYHKRQRLQKTQEFLVLGSQTLAELKDRIYCLTDRLMEAAGQHNPSGYFLIEDTFCNDLRSPSAIDYSSPIFDWLENSKNEVTEKWEVLMSGNSKKNLGLLGDSESLNLPTFKKADMHKIRFSDLRFRMGAGYLYFHQGNCKHIIVIRDMRLVHPEDVQNQAEYPLLTFELRKRYRKCSVCDIYHAAKMTIDDKWSPKNPCYFCVSCYALLHYKEDELLYPHSVFDYYHE